MESDDAAFIRRFMDAANGRDLESVHAGYHPDVELVAYASATPDAGQVKGRPEVLRWFGDWFDGVIDDWRTHVLDLWEPAEGVVVTRSRVHGRGRASGIPMEGETLYNGFAVRDRQVTRISVGVSFDEAVAGVGRSDLAGTVDVPPNEGASQ